MFCHLILETIAPSSSCQLQQILHLARPPSYGLALGELDESVDHALYRQMHQLQRVNKVGEIWLYLSRELFSQ